MFSPSIAEQSLIASLRELCTDYIDLYLLHEPACHDHIAEDLVAWLERQRAKGTIREYGLSGEYPDVTAVSRQFPGLCRVLQFASDVFDKHIEAHFAANTEPAVTFGVLGSAHGRVLDYLKSNAPGPDRSSKALHLGTLGESQLADAIIAYSVRANENGVVLLSTTRQDRIHGWVRAVETVDQETVDQLVALAHRIESHYAAADHTSAK